MQAHGYGVDVVPIKWYEWVPTVFGKHFDFYLARGEDVVCTIPFTKHCH